MSIVLKAYTGVKLERIFGMRGTEWMIVNHPFERPIKVSKKEALEYIRLNNLILCSRNEDGDVYDTPKQAFRKKYKGYGSDEKKKKKIDEAMKYFKSSRNGEEGED